MQFNEHKAQISELIKSATNELLKQPDWGANTSVCDALNQNPALGEEVARTIKKRLTQKGSEVALLALTLLDAIMKNCNCFHHIAASEDFLKTMEKLLENEKSGIFHRKQSNEEIRVRIELKEKSLVMIQSWAESFDPRQYPSFSQLYQKLRAAGVVFPRPLKDEVAPVFTPPIKVPKEIAPRPKGFNIPFTDPECVAICENAKLLFEMLSATADGEDLQKNDLIQTLIQNARTAQNRTLSRLQSGKDSDAVAMDDLLRINDILLDVIKYYNGLSMGSMERLKQEDLVEEKKTAATPKGKEQNSPIRRASNARRESAADKPESTTPRVVVDILSLTPRTGSGRGTSSNKQNTPNSKPSPSKASASPGGKKNAPADKEAVQRAIPVLSPPPSSSGTHRSVARSPSTENVSSSSPSPSAATTKVPGGVDILNFNSPPAQPSRSASSKHLNSAPKSGAAAALPPQRAPLTILDDIFDPLATGSVVNPAPVASSNHLPAAAGFANSPALPSYPILKTALAGAPPSAIAAFASEPGAAAAGGEEEDDPFMSLAARDVQK